MSYSSDELKAAVSGLVQGTASFKRDVLGPRDASSSFDEIRELVNSTLLYEPDSVFYLIYIATQSLQKVVTDEVEILDELLDAVDDLLKPNKPIESVSSIAEASVALSAMGGAIQRSGRVGTSEYGRYLRAIEKSKRTLGSTTKLTFTPRGSSQAITDIVRPAAKARKDSTTRFSSLKAQHMKLLERVRNLRTSYEDFNLDELATLVAKTQVSRAQSQMSSLYSELRDLSPVERTERARDALLKVLANKSVLASMTDAPTPGSAKLEQTKGGAATFRLYANGTGSAPVLQGEVSAPFPLELGSAQNLTLTLNDHTPDLNVDLLPAASASFVTGIRSAQLKGSAAGPFQLTPEVTVPYPILSRAVSPDFGLTTTTNLFHMTVDGVSYEVTLPTGAASTPVAVAAAIDAAIPTITATAVSGNTQVQIVYSNGSPPARYSDRSMHILVGHNNAVLGPYMVGGVLSPLSSGNVVYNRGWNSNLELMVKPNDDPAEEAIVLTAGAWTGDPQTSWLRSASSVRTMINNSAVGFSASLDGDRIVLTSIEKGEGSILTIVTDNVGGANSTPSFNGAATLGFYEGQEDRQRDVDGRVVTNLLNENVTFAAEAVAKTTYTELLRVRRASVNGSFDNGLDIPVDEDPAWSDIAQLKVRILSGDNAGTYEIDSASWSAGILMLRLSKGGSPRRLREQDTTILHEVVVYRELIGITSLDNSTAGLLEAKNSTTFPARAALGLPTGAIRGGVSKVYIEYNDPRLGWVPADLRRRLIKVGDPLRRLDPTTEVTRVSSVSQADIGILGVSPQVDPLLNLTTTHGFDIRSDSYLRYRAFDEELEDWWLELPPFDDEELQHLDKLLSPILLVNATVPRVNAVYAAVEELKNKLTGVGSLLEVLQGYSVLSISQVDQVLQTLLEQGHDRARKLLITGAIAEYMKTTKESSSYGKAVMRATSAVVVQDVNEPTNLTRHLSEDRERVVAEWWDDKNPLYDFSDEEDDLSDPAALDFWERLD